MPLRSWSPGKTIANLRGMWSYITGRHKGNPARANWAANMRVNPGIVVSRDALVPTAFDSYGAAMGLFNWIAPDGTNYVLYQGGDRVWSLVQDTGVETELYNTGTAWVPIFTPMNVWMYFCGWAGLQKWGTIPVHIFDGTNVDVAFRAPIVLTSATAVDGGAGQCTAGTHYFGVCYQNRTGFTGRPTITLAGAPISVTLNAGLRKVNVTMGIPALADGGANLTGGTSNVFLVATRADNPNVWYFVPPAAGGNASVEQVEVPNNSAITANFVMDISDEDLAGYADPISGPNANPDQFLILSQDAAGNGPFFQPGGAWDHPLFMVAYGTRMCYGIKSTLWVSDKNNPQLLRAADSFVQMPNQRHLMMAFPIANSSDLYLTGDGWTAKITDNSDTPSTWAPPLMVSEAIGAPNPSCVCYRTGGNYVWIVSERGVDLFAGTYANKPITYLVSDQWARVNWEWSYTIQVCDDVVHNRLYVAVPLDGAILKNTHVFVIDYTNGMTFDTCDITLDDYGLGYFSGIGIVKEVETGQSNVWVGPYETEILPPDLPQTGVWLSKPTVGQVNPNMLNGSASVTGDGAGTATFVSSHSLRDRDTYPGVMFSDLESLPSGTKFAFSNVEWPEIWFHSTFQQGTVTQGIYALSAGLGLDFDGLSSGLRVTTDSETNVTLKYTVSNGQAKLGYHDDLGDSIVSDLMNFEFRMLVWNTTNQEPIAGDTATATLSSSAMALYFKAIRINCGGSVDLSLQQERYPDGYFTFVADDNALVVSGGTAEILTTPETTLYNSRRHGASFTYTFGPGLFSEYYANTSYLVMLYFVDPVATATGQDVFTVTINGTVVDTIDIFSETTKINTPYTVEYPVTVAGKDNLVIEFAATAGEAMCSGIRVAPVAPTDPEVYDPTPSVWNVGKFHRFDEDTLCEVPSAWESGYIRGDGEFASKTIRVGGVDLWARGSGGVPAVTVAGLDKTKTKTPTLLGPGLVPVTTLSDAPGIVYETRVDLTETENYTVKLEMPANAKMEISGLVGYAKPSAFNR